MIFILFERAYAISYLVINSNLGPISHRLATIARTDLESHPYLIIFMSFYSQYATSY